MSSTLPYKSSKLFEVEEIIEAIARESEAGESEFEPSEAEESEEIWVY